MYNFSQLLILGNRVAMLRCVPCLTRHVLLPSYVY